MAVAGLLFPAVGPAAGATNRMTLDECAAQTTNAEANYTVVDSSDNSKCVSNPDGTFVWIMNETITEGRFVKGKVQFWPTNSRAARKAKRGKAARGDKRLMVNVYFIRGNKVLVKRLPIDSNGRVKFRRKLNLTGTWAVVIARGGRTLSTTVQVTG